MKIELTYSSGFSSSLVKWHAVLIVGARGSLQCSWTDAAGIHERQKPRHAFALDEAAFERAVDALRILPAEVGPFVDDAPTRRIVLFGPDGELDRARIVARHGDDADAVAFDAIWQELALPVRPVLRDLGMPPELAAIAL